MQNFLRGRLNILSHQSIIPWPEDINVFRIKLSDKVSTGPMSKDNLTLT